MLDRVIFNGIPVINDKPADPEKPESKKVVCRPYIQLFKNGALTFSSLDQYGHHTQSVDRSQRS